MNGTDVSRPATQERSNCRPLAKRVPVLLTTLRALLATVAVLLSLYAPRPAAFAACLSVALLSDIFDGVLARRLGVATPTLRRFDSRGDTLF